jgi:hypothetical protein
MPTIPAQTAERDAARVVVPRATAVAATTVINGRVPRSRRNPLTAAGHVQNSATVGRRHSDAVSHAPQRRDTERRPAPSAPPTLPIEVTFQPEEKGFAAMIEAMKHNQRAYTLFDIAKLVLNKPERHLVKVHSSTRRG